ncbi:uncharacterized protein L969DRAFT_93849 [Mixia osmundae IAM 14324]|uniref:RRM domain-containing protein n=1 Tax=Mixia osmundae (strain CBS 9802 / IAM 14324 / JCM 22182 / KY 12970) TaxID=764103 RepID=G7E9S1_MIXOS|nr:uncharacterized protein L969DRAFT_93849 [Mixia osmundae IAM 14324]KEI40022.1 hypothetical protein L969DRAFT_93849 [Mixia osmundae IAM 14324]GAA99390.1 hypothetical protein E5Q_06087 [Mixia osmundae IAM 14324]
MDRPRSDDRRDDRYESDYRPSRRSPSPRRERSPPRRSRSPYSRSYRDDDRDRDRPPRDSHRDRDYDSRRPARGANKEHRVYVGNLSYQVRHADLKDFARDVGKVVNAEVLMTPNGMSKGCGLIEFETEGDARRAIKELNESSLLGRPVFVREDRVDDPHPGGGARSVRGLVFPRSGAFAPSGGAPPSKQLIVSGLSDAVGWQDLKDLFRECGDVIRADVHLDEDGRPRGSGMVLFSSAGDARAAIEQFDGMEINGMKLTVKEDRVRGSGPPTRGAYPVRGGRGGGGSFGSGEPRPDRFANIDPSPQIFVKNLPWSTANEDLVELFQTVGTVLHAEATQENGRAKGTGVVEFATADDAQTAITKFQGYSYGGRPLVLAFNARTVDFTKLERAA